MHTLLPAFAVVCVLSVIVVGVAPYVDRYVSGRSRGQLTDHWNFYFVMAVILFITAVVVIDHVV